MPIPYEPILRHEPVPTGVQCLECQYDSINHICANPECHCACRESAAIIDINDHRDPLPPEGLGAVADWGEGTLIWHEPPAGAESISWYETPDATYPEADPNAEDMEAYRESKSRNAAASQYIEGNIGHHKTRMQGFIAKWEVPWAVLTTLLYLAAVILLVTVFPDVSNTWVSVFVLVSGLTASLTALASVLKTKE